MVVQTILARGIQRRGCSTYVNVYESVGREMIRKAFREDIALKLHLQEQKQRSEKTLGERFKQNHEGRKSVNDVFRK